MVLAGGSPPPEPVCLVRLLATSDERVLTMPTERATEVFAYASDAVFEQPAGLTFPGVFALIARAHMAKHGTTEEQMAHVAVKSHSHAAAAFRSSCCCS